MDKRMPDSLMVEKMVVWLVKDDNELCYRVEDNSCSAAIVGFIHFFPTDEETDAYAFFEPAEGFTYTTEQCATLATLVKMLGLLYGQQ